MTEQPEPIDPPAAPTRISPALIVMAVIPILGLIAAVGLLLSEPGQTPEATGQPARVGALDQSMPEFTLTTLDGQPVDLEDYRGRPIFMNFWGTWCPPCVAELPELQDFAAAQGEDGALVIASNNSESAERIYQYFEDNDLDLPDILFVLDSEHVMYRWFGVFQMPTTYLIDGEGVVRDVKYGAFEDTDALQEYLDKLAASSSGA
jgi:thiol-disulfide isomerase/thioredoxin